VDQIEELKKEIEVLKIQVKRLEDFIRAIPRAQDYINNGYADELFEEATRLIKLHSQVSASLLQRRLSIGYSRAARILDQLEEKGLIGRSEGSQPRKVIKK